jgi:hypothetical protein
VRRAWTLAAFAVFLLSLPAAAFAQSIPTLTDLPTGPRPDSWHIWNGTAIGLNGPVFGDLIKIYRKMPWGEGTTLLTSDSHWRYGIHNTACPVFDRPAVLLGVSPLLILDVDVHYGPEIDYIYNNFSSLRDKYFPQHLPPSTGHTHIVQHAQANTVFKIGVGPVAALTLNDFDYFKNNEPYFNWDVATIIKEGFVFRSKTMLLFEFMKDWRFMLDYQNIRYFETGWRNESAGAGFLVMNPAWNHIMVISQLNYYIHNPDFKGLLFWSAVVMEWDFPDKR